MIGSILPFSLPFVFFLGLHRSAVAAKTVSDARCVLPDPNNKIRCMKNVSLFSGNLSEDLHIVHTSSLSKPQEEEAVLNDVFTSS